MEQRRALAHTLLRPPIFAALLVGLSALVSIWLAGDRLGGSDEGAMLTAAARILRGGVFYRDIDAYPFPGSHYLLAAAMALFSEHLAVARGLAATVFAVILVALYATAVELLGRTRAALFGLALLSFKVLAWPGFTAFFYWDLGFLGACVCIALLVRHRFSGPTPGLAGAGVGAGIALISKQSLGIYVGAAALILLALPWARVTTPRDGIPSRAREIATFALGMVLPLLPLVAYLGVHGLLDEMFYSGLVRPFSDYLRSSGVAFAVPLRWWEFGSLVGTEGFAYLPEPYWNLLYREVLPGRDGTGLYAIAGEIFARWVYTSLPVAFVTAGAVVLRDAGQREQRRGLLTLTALALATALSAFPRADFAHVISVYPVVLLLLLAGAGHLVRSPQRRGLAVVEGVATLLVLCACGALALVLHRSLVERIDLERASLRVAPEDAFVESVVRFAREEVGRGESIFVYGNEAFYYFLADRYSPWRFSQLYPGQAGGDGGRTLVRLLASEPPRMVIQGHVRFPGVPAIPDYAPALDRFVRAHYRRDHRVFRHYPVPGGVIPRTFQLSVLRPRAARAAAP